MNASWRRPRRPGIPAFDFRCMPVNERRNQRELCSTLPAVAAATSMRP
jgi:hypothetical protein